MKKGRCDVSPQRPSCLWKLSGPSHQNPRSRKPLARLLLVEAPDFSRGKGLQARLNAPSPTAVALATAEQDRSAPRIRSDSATTRRLADIRLSHFGTRAV